MSAKISFWLSWLPALSCMALLFFLSSLPGDQVHLPDFWNSDKLVHFLAYSGLSLMLSSRLWLRSKLEKPVTKISLTHEWISIPIGILYGVSDEIHQRFVPLREFSYLDMLADSCGIIAGYFLFGLILTFMLRHRKVT